MVLVSKNRFIGLYFAEIVWNIVYSSIVSIYNDWSWDVCLYGIIREPTQKQERAEYRHEIVVSWKEKSYLFHKRFKVKVSLTLLLIAFHYECTHWKNAEYGKKVIHTSFLNVWCGVHFNCSTVLFSSKSIHKNSCVLICEHITITSRVM